MTLYKVYLLSWLVVNSYYGDSFLTSDIHRRWACHWASK